MQGRARPLTTIDYRFLRMYTQAEESVVAAKYDKEYLPITGFGDFVKNAVVLAYGKDSSAVKEGRVAATQSISGTGALRIGGAFLQRHYPHSKTIFLPTPSWGNHTPIFKDSGLEVKQYRYYDKKTVGLDFQGMIEDIKVCICAVGWFAVPRRS